MAQRFNMSLRSQQEWSWLLAIWLFLGGSGAGLFLLFQIFALPPAFAGISLALVMAGGVVLLSELGNPQRVWRTVSRPGTSWLSRGVLFVLLFIVTGFLSVAPEFAAFSSLPWDRTGTAGRVLGWIASLGALMIILYPGFFFSSNRAIPFWNTPFIPVIFIAYAALGAAGIVLALSEFLPGGMERMADLAGALIVLNMLMVAVYLMVMRRAGGAAGESVRLLGQAALGRTMWIGVVLVGMVLPLAAIIWFGAALTTAGACILTGCLLFRYCVLKAGVYVPPALVTADYDFSKLNRNNADLKREYTAMAAHGARGAG